MRVSAGIVALFTIGAVACSSNAPSTMENIGHASSADTAAGCAAEGDNAGRDINCFDNGLSLCPTSGQNSCNGLTCIPGSRLGGMGDHVSLGAGEGCECGLIPVYCHYSSGGNGSQFIDCECSSRSGGPSNLSLMYGAHYLVLAMMYAPPGKGSKMQYTEGSTISTIQVERVTTQVGGSGGVKIAYGGVSVGGGGKFSGGTVSGNSTQWDFSSSYGPIINSQSDTVDHGYDQFLLLLDPQVQVTANGVDIAAVYSNLDDQSQVWSTTLAELEDPSRLPPAMQAIFAGLTPADREAIASLNPWHHDRAFNPANSTRFKSNKVNVQLRGPSDGRSSYLGDVYTSSVANKNGELSGTTHGWEVDANVALTAPKSSGGFSISFSSQLGADPIAWTGFLRCSRS
jgi:hypothetical protein